MINGYIRQKDYEPAYRLFLFSLSDQERTLGGYIFNGGFEPVRSGKPFDWQVHDRSGLEITFAGSRDVGENDSGATVRFLNTPVKNAALQQYIELPPGSYRISLTASGRNLKLPKQLFWSIRCADPASEIARFNIPEGTFNQQDLSLDFAIGPSACPMQLLRLETAAIAESWRFRYVGTLVMHKLSIERVHCERAVKPVHGMGKVSAWVGSFPVGADRRRHGERPLHRNVDRACDHCLGRGRLFKAIGAEDPSSGPMAACPGPCRVLFSNRAAARSPVEWIAARGAARKSMAGRRNPTAFRQCRRGAHDRVFFVFLGGGGILSERHPFAPGSGLRPSAFLFHGCHL
ncbi:hypothetical protein [Mesorhizobium sp. M1406]|uniref:hypothetical protein n=1 Tax=Mesorhizobium sp. M1406 TaxID=2957099 RepID=UPI0033357E2F